MAEATILEPGLTTVGDLCGEALRECGAWGQGTTPGAEDMTAAQARLQWMLQQWERKRWLVYHLVTLSIVANGKGGQANPFTVGPGGDFDTSAVNSPWSSAFNNQFGGGQGPPAPSMRPAKLESAYLRQLVTSVPNQPDFPLEVLESMEDYNRIALKSMISFPVYAFLDPAWPLAQLFVQPVPNANIYSILITIRQQLPTWFPTLAVKINLPYEYYQAILTNLALRLRPRYGIPTPPGDTLVALAKDALGVLRGSNSAIARLGMPQDLVRRRQYNIFSDQSH